MDQSQGMPTWGNLGNRLNFTRGESRGSSASKHGSLRERTNQINNSYCWIHHSLRLRRVLTFCIVLLPRKKLKSDVPCDSATVKTDNSLRSDSVKTLNMVKNVSDTVETFDSVKTGNLIEQEKHCKLCSCCNSCPVVEKIKIKPVKHASFVNRLCSVPHVENVQSVAPNLPMGGLRKT